MSITAQWDDPQQTIIRISFSSEWSWDEFFAIDARTNAMLDGVNHRVCYLADMRATSMIPRGMRLDIIRQVLNFQHPNSDLLVVVGINRMMWSFFNSALLAIGLTVQVKTVKTIDDAYRVIQYRLLEIERSFL